MLDFLFAAPVQPAPVPPLVFMAEADENHRQIMRWDGPGHAPQPLTQGKAWHLYPDISADGTKLVFAEGPDQNHLGIKLVDLAAGTQRWLIKPTARFLHPKFTGDGKQVFFAGPPCAYAPNQIAAVDLETGKTRWLLSPHAAYFPTPSSDGGFLVYQGDTPDHKRALYRRSGDGKDEPVRLTRDDANAMAPALSPDDRRLAFTMQVNNNWDVYVRDLDAKAPQLTRVTTWGGNDFAPTFRPDGSLVFASPRGMGPYELYGAPVQEDAPATLLFKAPAGASCYAPASAGTAGIMQKQGAPIPAPARSSFGAAALGADLYVVGGHQGHEHTYPPESFLDRVDRLDAATGTWGARAARPDKAHGLQVVAWHGALYAFGGFAYATEHTPHWRSLDSVDRYDPATDRWTRVATLPRKRSSHVAALVGDQVYLIGGWDSTPKRAKDADGRFHPEIDVFDLRTNAVSTLEAQLPQPLRRAFTGWVMPDGRVVLAGGIGEGASHFKLLDQVTTFDPARGAFAELPKLPFPTFAPALGQAGDSLYLFGGMFGSGDDYRYVNHIFGLPLAPGGTWGHTGRYLSEPKGFSQVVETRDGLAILGGHTYLPDGTDTPVDTLEYFKR